ncbi:YkvA family protein [Sphingobacterium sp. BN32]|uniref:YkvA family protein n=1 Tax=Sphingobacterium sp. BN32 TaxID=3058432 RepID=UPI00265C9AA9|nr:YkvA family protein [Sphingobacterium sp. BN32]WKK59571.1 YkvA family protein [Sphingobacterium sp. BN32]
MKKNYFSRALLLFNTFKNRKLTREEIDLAEDKAQNLGEKSSDFGLLISMIKDTFAGRYKMNKWNMSVIVATIVYVVSPLDAIPDIIPVLGWLDDASIVGFAISKLADEILRYKKFKRMKPVQLPVTE